MSEFDDDQELTRDTPLPTGDDGDGWRPPGAADDDEPELTRDTPLPSAQPAAQEQQRPAWEGNASYDALPEAWKRQVRAGDLTPESAYDKHIRNKEQAAERARRSADHKLEQVKLFQAQSSARLEERLDRMARVLSGEIDPTAQPEPVDPALAHMQQLGQKVDQLAALQVRQVQEASIERQIDGIESWAADSVEQVLADHPEYPEAEEYILQRMEDGNLSFVQEQYPHLTDAEAIQYARQLRDQQVANMTLSYAQQGRNLAAETLNLAYSLGYGQQQPAYAAPPPPVYVDPRVAQQRARAQTAATFAGNGASAAQAGSARTMLEAALEMDDDAYDQFLTSMGKDSHEVVDQRFKDLLKSRSV